LEFLASGWETRVNGKSLLLTTSKSERTGTVAKEILLPWTKLAQGKKIKDRKMKSFIKTVKLGDNTKLKSLGIDFFFKETQYEQAHSGLIKTGCIMKVMTNDGQKLAFEKIKDARKYFTQLLKASK
jgi:hypothetical protein